MSFTNNLNVLNHFVLLCLTYCAAVFLSDLYLTSLSDSADGTKLIDIFDQVCLLTEASSQIS